MSIKGKLNRLKNHIVKEEADKSKSVESSVVVEEIPFLEKWAEFGAQPFYFDDTYCMVRKVEYPLDYQHGLYSFSKLKDVIDLWNTSMIKHPLSAKSHQLSDLFFFDTETTGLGGGAGNTIFLLGHARIHEEKIVLTQHFLPNPGAEVALYQSFLSSVDYTTLVTYNGKSFDWPQVKTRHTLIRDALPKLPDFGHFDLYHAARRLWKNKLDSVRLSNVEKEILDIKRSDDVPGYLAPIIYFDFVENQVPDGIFGVMRHNEIDILSLLTLYIHLSGAVMLNEKNKYTSDKYEVARWLEALGETRKAQELYEQVIEVDADKETKAKLALAFLVKKEKKLEEAIELFLEVQEMGDDHDAIVACIELSKYYEHHRKDYETALDFANTGYLRWKESRNSDNNTKNANAENEFEKRIARISRKFQKSL
ncbi:ribonuclease H-like domain-containing protein [Bacillus sp. REN16]|uniref:ribonuclease H-like domain-containing protein n=1 Tax=Bacillus sp. REN16 TaxID=2887296 RepID=UPI001E2EB722|nr:ribonuclease H-like domain-containing protein [Bacillus sp. REN16]MCC3358385.1 ribonuclease H-like domain-containing protein [Bacillus sp. REN16]